MRLSLECRLVVAGRLIAGSSALVAAGALAAATVAPGAAQRSAIIRAFGDPPVAGPCLIVRLAASDRRYADVRFRPTTSCARWAFNGVNVLERTATGAWKIHFEGSSYRCPIPHVPRAVQRDLGVCPT